MMGTNSWSLWQADGESAASWSLRQADGESAASARCVADGNAAAMRMADFPGDGEAEAEMILLAAGGIRLIEAVKYFFLIGVRNADSSINDLKITFPVRGVNV